MQIIGIDCAAQPTNVGYAYYEGGAIMANGSGGADPAVDIVELVDWASPILIAMDAPLGWPLPMSMELGDHRPGELIETPPNELFRRRTDRVVHDALRKPPLEVGADRIARTAHAALRLLQAIRERSGQRLPVLLDPWTSNGSGVVEVYPAATLKARGYPFQGYKKPTSEHRAKRREILRCMEGTLFVPNWDVPLESDHALDAIICVLAAVDFLNGECIAPGELDQARTKEGWIWFRDPALVGG